MSQIRLIDDSTITSASNLDLEAVPGRHKEPSAAETAACLMG